MTTKKGAVSLRFTYTPSDSAYLLVKTSIIGIPAYELDSFGYHLLDIKIVSDSDGNDRYFWISTLLNSTPVDTSVFLFYNIPTAQPIDVWIYLFDTNVSVYFNGNWVYSYVMAFSDYLSYTPTISIKAVGGSIALSNIRREEIPDQRDAVYVDYESTGDNAIQSIYQQRPVLTSPDVENIMNFTYGATLDEVPSNFVRQYSLGEVVPSDLSSDGLVYYYDVAISVSAEVAKEVGFITRLYRLSELNSGGQEATNRIQKIALGHRHPVQLVQRLDPRLQLFDRIIIDLVVSGTETHITDDIIVEDIDISTVNGKYASTITGRRTT
jgi:hypothetical protein